MTHDRLQIARRAALHSLVICALPHCLTSFAGRGAGLAWAQAPAVAECYRLTGRPLGVGRVFLPNTPTPELGLTGLQLSERGGRVHYAVVEHRRRRLIGNRRNPPGTTIYFLFSGDETLNLELPEYGAASRRRRARILGLLAACLPAGGIATRRRRSGGPTMPTTRPFWRPI